MDLKGKVLEVLSKNKTIDEVSEGMSAAEVEELNTTLELIKSKMQKGCHEVVKFDNQGQWRIEKEEKNLAPVKTIMDKDLYEPRGKHNPVMESPANMKKEEQKVTQVKTIMDSDLYEPRGKHDPVMAKPANLKKGWVNDAQWTLEKAAKEGLPLDYKKMNPKPDYAEIEAKAPTIDYKNNNPKVAPTWTGAAARRDETRARIDSEAKETALDTIKRKQQMNKVGVNEEEEPSEADKKKMSIAKQELANPNITGINAPEMQMSEKEPHKDDPDHEKKEQEKAKKIKEDAQDLLDMHKAEKQSNSVFSMSHAHEVAGMPHANAKAHLHSIVDASTANPANKKKIKMAIDASRNSKDLSSLVANHVLAAGGGGTKVGELKVIR